MIRGPLDDGASCSAFPRKLRGVIDHVDDRLVLPEGIPFPEHGWKWVLTCTDPSAWTMPRRRLSDAELIARHRLARIASLLDAIDATLHEAYIVIHCPCGEDPVHSVFDQFCGHCGRPLQDEASLLAEAQAFAARGKASR